MGFPFPFMGGAQASTLISNTASDSGAMALPGKIILKLFRNYHLHMEKVAAEISSYFK